MTLKKSLLESELPIVADWDQAKVGVITDGVISKIVEKGAIIDLYGGLRAFVPISEARFVSLRPLLSLFSSDRRPPFVCIRSDSYIQNLADAHHIGKPVKIKITSVDPPLRKIGASIRQASQPSTDEPMEGDDDTLAAAPVASNLTDVEVGNVLSGTVTAVHAQHVLLTLIPSQAKALLSVANLANSQSISVDEAKKAVKLGSTLDNLVVVAKDEAKGLAFVSNKPKQAVKEKKEKREKLALEALDYDSLPVGEILPGRVLSHSHQGAIVLVGKSLKGRVNPTDLSDDFAAQSTFPDVGKVVRVAVLKVDPSSHIIDLSLRPSRTNPDREAKVIDKEIASIEDLEKGQVIRGFVKNISDGGLYVTLSRDVTARVMIRNLFDEVRLASSLHFLREWLHLTTSLFLASSSSRSGSPGSRSARSSRERSSRSTRCATRSSSLSRRRPTSPARPRRSGTATSPSARRLTPSSRRPRSTVSSSESTTRTSVDCATSRRYVIPHEPSSPGCLGV